MVRVAVARVPIFERESDAAVRAKLRGGSYPDVADPEKAFVFHWADGRGICAFRKKSDALKWLSTARDVVKFWYGAPVSPSGKRLRVVTSYSPTKNEEVSSMVHVLVESAPFSIAERNHQDMEVERDGQGGYIVFGHWRGEETPFEDYDAAVAYAKREAARWRLGYIDWTAPTGPSLNESAAVTATDVKKISRVTSATMARKFPLQSKKIDWGTGKARGQGRRRGGMIMGGMSDAPQGVKTYPDRAMTFGLRGSDAEEVGSLSELLFRHYYQARASGYSHGQSAAYAYGMDDGMPPLEIAGLMNDEVNECAVVEAEDAPVTQAQLKELERQLDAAFKKAKLDIEFTRHFFERVNDPRNQKQITVAELQALFRAVKKKFGKAIQQVRWEGVLRDKTTRISVPFALEPTKDGFDLIAKTVMRKKGFRSPDKPFVVASGADEADVDEGVNDPHILKAVFLAGGGGSGKGFIGGKAFGGTGLKVVNSDDQFEHLMRRAGLSLKTQVGDDAVQRKGGVRDQAKDLTAKKKGGFLAGRLGIIMDSTAAKTGKIVRQKAELEALGYDTYMLFVSTSLDVSLERNQKRERVVPEAVVRKDHEAAKKAKALFRTLFGASKFTEVNNDKVLSDRELRAELVPKLTRIANRWIGSPVQNPIGKKWVERERAAIKSRGSGRRVRLAASHDAPDVFPAVDETEIVQLPHSLGVQRSDMPQIQSTEVQNFLQWMFSGHDVRVQTKRMKVKDLRPTQKHANPEKADALAKLKGKEKPVIVSSDGRLLDGHHRWFGLLRKDPDITILTHQVSIPMRKLLRLAKTFPKAFQKGVKEAAAVA